MAALSDQGLQLLAEHQTQFYWLHIEVPMVASKLKKLINLHAKRKPYSRYAGTGHYYLMTRQLRKKGITLLDARIISIAPNKIIPQKALNFFFRDVQEFLNRLDQKKTYEGDSGSQFLLPRANFKFKGGVDLPIKFRMDPSLTERLGAAEVKELELSFETSPMGLARVNLSVTDKHITVGVETDFYSSSLSGLTTQTFIQARTIGSLFVEGEK